MTFDVPPVAVVTLTENERRVLARWHPELGGYTSAVVIVSSEDMDLRVAAVTALVSERLNGDARDSLEEAVERVLAELPLLQSPEDARHEAQFRRRAVDDYGAYTAAELGALHSAEPGNRSKVAAAWRAAGRIFAVPYQGQTVYLAFQFDDDVRPITVVRHVLRSLAGWPPWAIAAWFLRPNGALDNHLPVELLRTDPEWVRQAAAGDGRAGLSPLRRPGRRRHSQASSL